MMSILIVYIVMLIFSINADDDDSKTCPCSDTSLCQPLSENAINSNNGKSLIFTNAVNSTNQGKYWDFDKIGAWAPFNHLGPNYPTAQELYCKAHSKNIPVYTWGYESWDGGSCPVTKFYSWALTGNSNVYDKDAVNDWASETASCVIEKGFDGILLDMEGIGGPPLGPESMLDAIYYAICTLKQELTKKLSYSKIYWTADTGPYFPYEDLTTDGCVDMWIDMAYDWCVAQELNIDYRNRANSPLPYINTVDDTIVPTYTKTYNVPLDKLGVAFPWYGCQFNCTIMDENGPYLGCVQAELLGTQPTFDQVIDKWLPAATSDVVYNDTAVAMLVNSQIDGYPQQVWYDDDTTLKKKYDEALNAGVKLVGMWTVDMVDEHADTAEKFWNALP